MDEYEKISQAWQADARAKNLPEEFIERLADSDGVTEVEKARIVRSVQTAGELLKKREAAVEYGRLLGEDEANRRRQTGVDREQRVARAMCYAAWVFDGKPVSSKAQREEFGVRSPDIAASLERPATPRLLQKEKG